MSSANGNPPLNLLQRVDLVLAERIAAASPGVEELATGGGLPDTPTTGMNDWVAGLLGLRGLLIRVEDVEAVLEGRDTRFAPSHHEYLLITGMSRVYQRVAEQGDTCPAPEGWSLVDFFKDFTNGIARFRNNALRRDTPWDSVLFIDYPDHENVAACLDDFHEGNCYTDISQRFESLHPVRRAFRVMWMFARIAPFPDFNLTMAWIAMNMHLLNSGYPMLVPEREDRERLHRMVGGPAPLRHVVFESRLLASLEAAAHS